MIEIVGIAIIVGFFVMFVLRVVHTARKGSGASKKSARGKGNKAQRKAEALRADARKRDEALFVSMFPELQPYFHPDVLVHFVRAMRERPQFGSPSALVTWSRPVGFDAAAMELEPDGERIACRLKNAEGSVLSRFQYEPHPEGGVLRVAKGKLTVNVVDEVPRVRYWHPDREFKWSERKGWTFVTRVSEEPFSRSESSDSSSSSSFSRDATTAAAAAAGTAAIVAAGGTFDGGGASQGWEEGGGGDSGANATASAY